MKFRKGKFKSMFHTENNVQYVVEVNGYLNNDFGLYKDGNNWNIIDLFSGLRITSKKTKKECIEYLDHTTIPWDKVVKIRLKFAEILKQNYRLIALSDGDGMDGEIVIIYTDAPKERLKQVVEDANEARKEGEDIWLQQVLHEDGYVFDIMDHHDNVTPYGTAKNWLKDKYAYVNEKYYLEDRK